MNSSEISTMLGLPSGDWDRFDGTLSAPALSGVYVIRIASGKTVGRLRGESDLIYIGQGNLRVRTKAHANLRRDFRGKGWVLWLIAGADSVGGLEIAFFRCANPRQAENTLLFRYLTEHLELPPANNTLGALTDSQKMELSLMCLAPQSTTAQRESALKELLKRKNSSSGIETLSPQPRSGLRVSK